MTEAAKLDQLVEEVLENIPHELQEDLRNWINRASKGELTEVSQELLRKAQELWRGFDNAAKEVETKLRQ